MARPQLLTITDNLKTWSDISDYQLTTTTQTAVLTFTPTKQGNFIAWVYLRATGALNATVAVTYRDVGGAQTNTAISNQAISANGYNMIPVYLNAVAGTAVSINVTSTVANQLYASATIMGV